jgi:hypothetical protein
MLPLCIAGAAYLLAIRELFLTHTFPRRVIVFGLVLAALWHIAFVLVPTGTDDDVRRYVWDGRIQRLGYDPYVVVPADPTNAALHTAETRGLNNPDLATSYPPGAELFFRAVTATHESTLALRLAFVLCDVGVALVLIDILRYSGRGAHWVLAYAWHPLLATEVAGSGHVDIVGVLLLAVSFAALMRGRRAVAAVSFSLAVTVKLLPIVLLPLYWRRLRIRDAVLGTMVFVLVYLPFVHGRLPVGSLGTYIQSFRFNGPVFTALERVAAPQIAAAFAVAIGVAVSVWFRAKHRQLAADSVAWPMAASLVCAPVVYPWYLLWVIPFTRSAATLPILIWTVSIIPTYMVWHHRTLGRAWGLPGWILLVEYGAVVVTAVIVVWRRTKREVAQQRTAHAAPPPSM